MCIKAVTKHFLQRIWHNYLRLVRWHTSNAIAVIEWSIPRSRGYYLHRKHLQQQEQFFKSTFSISEWNKLLRHYIHSSIANLAHSLVHNITYMYNRTWKYRNLTWWPYFTFYTCVSFRHNRPSASWKNSCWSPYVNSKCIDSELWTKITTTINEKRG